MVLVRYVACFCFLMHIIFFIFLTIRGYHPVNMIYLISGLALTGIFALSFFVPRRDVIVTALAITNFAVCAVAGSYLGWVVSGYGFMYVTLMLIWFDSSKSMGYKVATSSFVSLAVCALFIIRGAALDIQLEHIDYEIMLVINTLILCGCISIVSYFLCRHNVTDERKLMQYNAKLKQMAGIDPLTGLMNRRAIGEKFEELLKGDTQCVTVAMGDIDFFKKVNDTRGHDCGDYVLKTLASLFREFMDGKGYVSRWGGEEFVFIFKDINGDDTYPMLEDLRRKIEAIEFEFFAHRFKITMTFGVEEYSPMFGSEEAIKKADEKLYIGKGSGRNQVVY